MLQITKNIDTKTGQVLSEKQKFFVDALTDEGYKVPAHKLGAKLFADVAFPEAMTDGEIGKMARLSKLMVSTTNMLGYRSRAGIKPYKDTQIMRLVGLSHRRGKEFLEKMISLGVMQKNIRQYKDVESEEFYINPAYFFAGRRISFHLYLLFREHLDQILPDWVRVEFWKFAKEKER